MMRDLLRLKNLLAKMAANGAVSMRDFEGAVGKDGVAEYEDLWQRELDQRKIFEAKPDEIKRYEELLHAGDFDENRADGNSVPAKRSKHTSGKSTAQRLRELSESKYEKAWEYLREIISSDGSLAIWFDRDLDFGAGSKISIDRVGMPRIVTSRSKYMVCIGAAQKKSKADVKMAVLRNAIYWIENPVAKLDELTGASLAGKLAKLRKSG
ncbi:MAG: hypothetical protein HYZ65_11805 [Burkholderiales bacterium]|nr:hypothetical protein [Burkholderiales bacterium]